MDNTLQLYIDEKQEIKGYPITSPDRVIDENGVNIEEKLDNITNRVTTLETNGGGSNLNLRDVVDGEIFKLYGTPDIPSEPDIPTNVPVSSVSLDRSSHELEVGQTIQLTATVLPSNATNKSITWTASNSNCTVNNGLVEAVNSGDCVITCTTVDGNKTASCNITIPVVEPDEPEKPDVPSSATLIHEWDLTETGSTIEDKVNNLDLVVNGDKKQISRYDNNGALNTNFILTGTESFSLDILVTPATVYGEEIIHTGHIAGVHIYKGDGETNHYRFVLSRGISYGNNKGLLSIVYRLNPDGSETINIENSQTTKDVQTNIKLVYNADKTELKVYQEDTLIFTDNRPYKIDGFNFTKADYCKVYKGCII